MNVIKILAIALSSCMCLLISCNKLETTKEQESDIETFVIPIRNGVKSTSNSYDLFLEAVVNCEKGTIISFTLSEAALDEYNITQEKYNEILKDELVKIGLFEEVYGGSTKATSSEIRTGLSKNWKSCGDNKKCKWRVALDFACANLDAMYDQGDHDGYPDNYGDLYK